MPLDELYRLKFIIRYSNLPRVRDESVAEHSFFVAAICIDILPEYPEADMGKVLLMANIHDWAEARIDDIAHDVKRDYPNINKAIKAAEVKVMKRYPQYVQDAYTEYEAGVTLEAKIVKLADIKQCIQYLDTEVELGNRFMTPLLHESYDSLAKFRVYTHNQTKMEFKDGEN